MASDNNQYYSKKRNLFLLKQQHLIYEAIKRNSLLPSSKLYKKQFPDMPILPSVSTDRIFVTEGYCLLSASILVCYDSKMNTGWWLGIVLWESSKDWSLTLILIQPWESGSTEWVWWSTMRFDDHRNNRTCITSMASDLWLQLENRKLATAMEFQELSRFLSTATNRKMNRIFKIAGDFLESVDQRADRTVNGKSLEC